VELNSLKIEVSNDETNKACPDSQEIIQLHAEINALEKDLSIINNRKKNVGVVFD
jgi:hypothetical protein